MGRRKASKSKRLRLKRSKHRIILALIVILLTSAIGTFLIVFSHAAPKGSNKAPTPEINPPLNGQLACTKGLNVALLADTSGSINSDELKDIKAAYTQFVNTLMVPTSPLKTKFSLTDFAGNAAIEQTLTPTLAQMTTAINDLPDGNLKEGTNWEAGLNTAYGTLPPVTPTGAQDLLIIATDGDPKTSDSGNDPVNDAVVVANTIKDSGVHILAIGEGSTSGNGNGNSGLNLPNLEAITGSNVNTGGVNADVIMTDYATMVGDLESLAANNCGNGDGNGLGTGQNGDGLGNGPVGNGNGPSGQGNQAGLTSGPAAQASPNPVPSSTNSTQPAPAPTPTPNQTPAPSPAATIASNQANPTPTPTSQGAQTKPPTPQPSPFYDGKQYAPGSAVDKLADTINRHGLPGWLYGLLVLVIGGAAGGFLIWRKPKIVKKISKKKTRSKK